MPCGRSLLAPQTPSALRPELSVEGFLTLASGSLVSDTERRSHPSPTPTCHSVY